MFHPKREEKILMIHCRRGLFTLTKCAHCGYIWNCPACMQTLKKGVNLVAYRSSFGMLELVCHQCQSYFKYPLSCPECQTQHIVSSRGGIDDLHHQLESQYGYQVIRLDLIKKTDEFSAALPQLRKVNTSTEIPIWLTTRVYDPAIDYSAFTKIIYIQAHNLLASTDYLVQEETMISLGNMIISARNSQNTEIYFDTSFPDSPFFTQMAQLHPSHENHQSIWSWFQQFIEQENQLRSLFSYPPHTNIILLTSHEKTFEKAKRVLVSTQGRLEELNQELSLGITIKSPYPARFLKRKGLFSYHILIRYPRTYTQFHLLKKEITTLASLNNLQIRHNPRHLF